VNLEVEASELIRNDFPHSELAEFVRRVCQWGGYAGVAGRVLKHNSPDSLRDAFTLANAYLAGTKPRITDALTSLRDLHGLGLSFASKHLRFLCPEYCPVFDQVLRDALCYTYNSAGYTKFAIDCRVVADALISASAPNPWLGRDCNWRAADVEAALFAHTRIAVGDWS